MSAMSSLRRKRSDFSAIIEGNRIMKQTQERLNREKKCLEKYGEHKFLYGMGRTCMNCGKLKV